MKTKEQVIDEMCITMRPDFLLHRDSPSWGAGMYENQREALRDQMRQLIEHHGPDIMRLFVMV